MKTILSVLLVLFVASTVALTIRNRALSRDLAEAHSAIAELSSAKPVVVQAAAIQEWKTEAPAPAPVETPAPAPTAVTAQDIPEDVLEQAVAAREEERRQQRNAERERRRQEWDNQTPEEREARRQEFRQRMQDRANERLQRFVERNDLDDAQCAALETVVTDLDARVRELSKAWSKSIREAGAFGPDARMQLINELSAIAMESYDGLDAALPATWREADANFNPLQVLGPDVLAPVMEAAVESGVNPGSIGAVMGMLMGGGERGPRGGFGGFGGGRNAPGGDATPPPPPGF